MLKLIYLIFLPCLCLYYVYKKYFVQSCPTVASIPNFWKELWAILTSDFRDLFKIIIKFGKFSDKNNGISKARIGPVLVYFISNVEDAGTVLNECLDKMFLYDFIVPYVGKEIVAAEGKVFKQNKRVFDQAFKQSVINSYLDVFNEQASRLVSKMSEKAGKGEVDVLPDILRVILESVCQTTMGLNMAGEDLVTDQYVDGVHRVLKTLTKRFQQPWLIPDFMFKISSLKKEQDDALKVVWKLSEKMVAKRKSEYLNRLRKNESFNYEERKFKSFLDIILENSMTEDSSKYTDLQLRQILDNILLAGFDTTTFEILYTLLLLGSNPGSQEKVYHEIKEVIGNKDRVEREDLPKLKYLEAVVKESVRLYPIGLIVARYADKDVQLKNNVKISKGSSIAIHVWCINRNPEYWGPDAEEFRPERWLNQESLPANPLAFASFVPGKRTCIGKTYAMMIMKIMLARLLQNYRFTADCSKLQFNVEVMLKPIEGYCMNIERR